MIENKSLSPGPGMVPGYDPSVFKPSDRGPALVSAHVPGSRSPPGSPPSRPGPGGSPSGSSPGSSPPRSGSKSDPASSTAGLPMYPPPGFPPQGVLLPNLSSPFSRPDSSFLLGSPMTDIHYSRHQSLQMVSPNDPTANACKIVDFHGEKIASFSIHGKTMLCLPQAFEIFLKNLVGGLHTVYTKCKRLGINPLVCNVEQVRVLRGLGSIQPGVNRCKLIADTDFEELMRDCNTSRPGRPPKRMTPITTFASMPTHTDPAFLGAMASGIPFPPPQQPRAQELPPGFNPFLPLGGSPGQAAQMAQHAQAQAALLTRNGLLPGASPSHEVMLEKYGHMLRHLQGLQKEDRGSSSPASPTASPPALNLSYRSEDEKHDDISDKSESELADIEDDGDEMDDNISEDNSIEAASGNNGNGFAKKPMMENGKENGLPSVGGAGAPNSNMFHFWQNIQGHIQDLVKTAIHNAKDDDESKSEDSQSHKDDVEKQLAVEKESLDNLRKQIEEAQKQSELYLRRFKKEKRLRRKIQSQLEIESFKKAKLEEALSTLSYKTFMQVKDLRNNEPNDKENFA